MTHTGLVMNSSLWKPTHVTLERLLTLIHCYQKPSNDETVNWCNVHSAIRCFLFMMENWENVTPETVNAVGGALVKQLQDIVDNDVESVAITIDELQVSINAHFKF